MNIPFGSCDFTGSRLVVCQRGESSGNWAQCGIYINGILISTGEGLLFARALEVNGQAVIVGGGHDSNRLTVITEDGRRVTYSGLVNMNRPCAIAIVEGSLTVSYMDTETSAQRSALDLATLTLTPILRVSCPKTSQGMIDAIDIIEFTDPVDRTLQDYTVRYPTTRSGVTLAQAADPRLSDGLVVARGTEFGMVTTGLVMEPHLSEDGTQWCGWTQAGHVVSGNIPAVLPPLIPANPMPDVSLVVPARKDFRLGAFVFNNAPNAEPNPHVPFGSFSIPVRLSTPISGEFISAGPGSLCYFAGADGSQTPEQAITAMRPIAEAESVGLMGYVDRTVAPDGYFRLLKNGDVFAQYCRIEPGETWNACMSRWINELAVTENQITRETGRTFPIVASLELQRLHPVDVANSIIACSRAYALDFGGVIFAKDRSDTDWAAAESYLTRWLSGVESPAPWPMPPIPTPIPPTPDPSPEPEPEPEPMPTPTLPFRCYALAATGSFISARIAENPNLLDIHVQSAGPSEEVEVAQSPTDGNAVTVRLTECNRLFHVDREDNTPAGTPAPQRTKPFPPIGIIDAALPDVYTTQQHGRLSGTFVIYDGVSQDRKRTGIAYALRLVNADGSDFVTGSGPKSDLAPLQIRGTDFVEKG